MSKKRMLFTDDVEDNLTSTYTDVPLSAKQGKVLNEKIEALPLMPEANKEGSAAVYDGSKWIAQVGYGYFANSSYPFTGSITVPQYAGDYVDSGKSVNLTSGYTTVVSASGLELTGITHTIDGNIYFGNTDASGNPDLSAENPVVLRVAVGGGNMFVASAVPLTDVSVTILQFSSVTKIDKNLIPSVAWKDISTKPFSDIAASNGLYVNTDGNLDIAYGAANGTVCSGSDPRLTDARTPTSHATSHATGGSDVIAPSDIGAQSEITSTSKLSSDLVDDTSATNKFVTGTEKTAWNGKQNALPDVFLQAIPANANLIKSNKDSSGVYLTYTWDLTTAITGYPAKWVSTLSADYLSRTLTVYGSDKTTVIATYSFTRTLDADGCLLTETLN